MGVIRARLRRCKECHKDTVGRRQEKGREEPGEGKRQAREGREVVRAGGLVEPVQPEKSERPEYSGAIPRVVRDKRCQKKPGRLKKPKKNERKKLKEQEAQEKDCLEGISILRQNFKQG